MIISLKLTQFRNHQQVKLDGLGAFVGLVGPNGSGKTNILEAISFLAPGRGLRRAVLSDVGRHGQDGSWSLFAEIDSLYTPHKVGTGLSLQTLLSDSNARDIHINQQKSATQNALLDICRLLWLTPSMDGLFTGGAGDRRRLLDRWATTFEPSHAHHLSLYEKAMRQRNSALQLPHSRPAFLDSLEDIMALNAVAVALTRHDHILKLQNAIDMMRGETAFPWSKIALEGDIESQIMAGATLTELEDHFKDQLCASRKIDKEAGRTTKGVHKSDLLVWHGMKNMEARLSSTGEQKALLIGLLLAQLELLTHIDSDVARILLLDEVAAHLDARRRQALFAHLANSQLQIWMTGTDEDVFRAIGHDLQLFGLSDIGHITRL